MTERDQEKAAHSQYLDMVVDFVGQRGGVSFVELQGLLAPHMEVKGDLALFLPGHENIILWSGMSQDFFTMVAEALTVHRIECRPTNVLVYMIDGGMLDMPLAKKVMHYKEPHWLPVSFHTYVPEPAEKQGKKKRKRRERA